MTIDTVPLSDALGIQGYCLPAVLAAEVPTPGSGLVCVFVDIADNHIKQKDSGGVVSDLAGGGGVLGPDPSNAVVAETSYGLLSTAGDATTYSRSNHTHGTPPLGDATPLAPGTPSAGSSSLPSRQDHIHPPPTGFALSTHDHDDVYSPLGHDHAGTYSPVAHDHDSRYYTEAESDARFATSGHTHAQLHNQQHAVTSAADHTFPGGTTNFLRADGTWATPPAGGGGGLPAESAVVLGADHANSLITATAVTGLAATLGVGTWLIKYWLVYRTAATTTGIQMYLDHTGTTSRLAGTWYQLTTGGAAATGIGDQATTATAQMLEGKGQRADNVASGPTQGVDTANADQFAVYEALAVVTASGTLNLMMNTEVAASAATIMAGSTLMLTQVA